MYEYVKFKETGYLGQITSIKHLSYYSCPELSVIVDGTGESIDTNLGQVELLTREQYLEEKERQNMGE